MSRLLIQNYQTELANLKRISGSHNEGVLSEAFKDLLKAWSRQQKLIFLPQQRLESNQKTQIVPDGTIRHDLRVDHGYWEAKDTKDDLDEEIRKKLAKGYPQTNIIFENSETAVLIQNRTEVMRCSMTDSDELLRMMELFFSYERPEIADFRKAVDQFKTDLPAVLEALRERINQAYDTNPDFAGEAAQFLEHARQTINPQVTEADIREMLIQHILTEDIFNRVFDNAEFHRDNNIARRLYALEQVFLPTSDKRSLLKVIEPYYATIRSTAALITSHSEKQNFLKVIYENFYKVYDKKKADRLGVVYTPNEIVKFMIEGADWLCQKHFDRTLLDPNVEILDPATGTGTFICELLNHFGADIRKASHKYKNELHANEVAILPYYVANLNIEATWHALSGQYAEFPNLCFVDTLDNVAGLGIRAGYQHDMFAGMSEENVERVRRQNARKISVIIGNPPYNANQANENDNNKNRDYPRIDELIRSTYIRLSTAQKTKLYDMYARFFRWASDRMPDEGVLAFITNRSFIESRTFDGFRKAVAQEFSEIHVVDLGGDVRANPKLSGTKHNVFGIQTGVAISFMIKKRGKHSGKIFYLRRPELDTAEDKLSFLATRKLADLTFERIDPDKHGNWINLPENNWDDFIPVADKKTKAAKTAGQEKAIFKLFSLGLVTARDDWVHDLSVDHLNRKVSLLISTYNSMASDGIIDDTIKLTRSVKNNASNRKLYSEKTRHFSSTAYRPFFSQNLFFDRHFNEMQYKLNEIFGFNGNQTICISGAPSAKPFQVLSVIKIPSYDLLEKTQCLPLYRYSKSGERIDNITDWALKQFRDHYRNKTIGRQDIFHYVYGVLHDPVYRETYALNLRREFPRIPYYPDFRQWADWGERLMALHVGFETVEPWPLERIDQIDLKAREAGVAPKALLKEDAANGQIRLDPETTLTGIPAEAFAYRLGNRSALGWICDQYREKTPKDPTIREKFNTYRFADYKDKVIDLIARVTRVSVETVAVIEAMRQARR